MYYTCVASADWTSKGENYYLMQSGKSWVLSQIDANWKFINLNFMRKCSYIFYYYWELLLRIINILNIIIEKV